jgi:hypothetical protein
VLQRYLLLLCKKQTIRILRCIMQEQIIRCVPAARILVALHIANVHCFCTDVAQLPSHSDRAESLIIHPPLRTTANTRIRAYFETRHSRRVIPRTIQRCFHTNFYAIVYQPCRMAYSPSSAWLEANVPSCTLERLVISGSHIGIVGAGICP